MRIFGVPLAIAVLVGVVCVLNHFHGVDWGDDFALYMRQAKALNIGNIGEVIRDNRYTVDNSGWHTFSPYLYPWGWPLLAAPVYAVFGLNFEAFKALEVLALCGFLVLFYDLARRRAGSLPAALLALLIGFSPLYVRATDTALSDLPYLAFVGLGLWWLDRCRRKGILAGDLRRLVAFALLAAFAFNIRREGFTLLVALAAVQLTALVGLVRRERSRRALREVAWKVVLLPYAIFAGAAAAFQVLLPTTFLPSVPGAGVRNIPSNGSYYRKILAENVGLKAAGVPMSLWQSRLVAVLVAFAVIGVAARLAQAFEEDIALVAFLASALLIALVSPYQEGRYVFAIVPLLVYFAYQALPALGSILGLRRPRLSGAVRAVAVVALASLVALNVKTVKHSTSYHQQYHLTVNGPEQPAAQEMLAAVGRITRADDIVLFFRARAMTLFTNRVALQGVDLDQMLPRVNWYVMEKGSTYSQVLLSDSEAARRGLTNVWEDSDWIIWRVPRRSP